MARNRGKRGYVSRREKLDKSIRNIRIIALFAGIAILFWIFFNRVYIYDYIRTSFH